MVKRTLNNFTYTRDVTQGKTVESLCNGLPLTKKDKKQYVVVYGTHEAIIDEANWFGNTEKLITKNILLFKRRLHCMKRKWSCCKS